MKVLILHNYNLPEDILSAEKFRDIEFVVPPAFRPASENEVENYDTFVDERLGEVFSGEVYDAVVMPFSFSEYNYMEFNALRVALHVRLTRHWKNIHTPVLFLGPDSKEQVAKISEFGSFLFTTNVFTSDARTLRALVEKLDFIAGISRSFSEEENEAWYDVFLDKINVTPPADYDTLHSTSNEWALIRWGEMFRWGDSGKPEIDNAVFKGMLYFKYIIATSGDRARFRSKNKKNPRIDDIEGRTFVLLDDSAGNGWEIMLRAIIERESGGKLYCFDSFDCETSASGVDTGVLEKEELMAKIREYLSRPEIRDADCYIVDLHLCEEDKDSVTGDASGFEVVQMIKAMNRANQIVVFTASDSVQDMKDAFKIINLAGYAVKEDPEENFTKGESYQMFCDFSSALVKASNLSYLKSFTDRIDRYEPIVGTDISLLDDVVDLLLVDRPELTIKAIVLNLVIFLENYLKDRFSVRDDGYLYLRRGGRRVAEYRDRLYFKSEREDGHSNVCDLMVREPGEQIFGDWLEPRDSDIRDMIVPLYFYYGVSIDDCREIINLKKLRNTRIAHVGGEVSISSERVAMIMDNVVFYVLECDSCESDREKV